MKKYIHFILIIPLFITATFFSYAFYLYTQKEDKISAYKEEKVLQLQEKYDLSVSSYIKLAHSLFITSVNKPQILSIVAQAVDADEGKKSFLRTKLHGLLLDDYMQLKEQIGIKQLHFHLPNNESFLRMHRPEKFGDDLTNVRESVRLTNLNQTFTQGFEEGKIFNGFRYVFPLFYEQKHVGSVELSISFTTLKGLLNSVFSSHYDFIVKADVVQAKVFENEQSNYLNTPYYKGYVRESYDNPYINDTKLRQETLQTIKERIKDDFAFNAQKQDSFVLDLYCKLSDTNCVATFLSVENLKNEHVAYIVAIDKDDTVYRIQYEFILQLFTLGAIYLLLPLLGYLFFIEKRRKDSEKKANTDFLTKALNRFGCQDTMKKLLKEYVKEGHNFSIIMFDIDYFKKINDSFGHDIGDVVLKELVALVQKNIRRDDTICRWGGEEFLVILPHVNYINASKISDKLLETVRKYHFTDVKNVTVSIGFTQVKQKDNIDSLIKRADEALYRSKHAGRDCATGDF
jgi:diguanylate cyclase (GGDEF)-like protein